MITKEALKNHISELKFQRQAALKQIAVDISVLEESKANLNRIEGGIRELKNIMRLTGMEDQGLAYRGILNGKHSR